jgi:hypothetical protein
MNTTMAIDLTQDQLLLLQKVNQYSEPNRRSDRMSVCMQQFGRHWDTSHVSFIGLQLRAKGYVTTFKDASKYAQWNITPLGKAALCEVANMNRPAKEAPVTLPKMPAPKAISQYRVLELSDGSVSDPKSLAEARKLAEKWAIENPGTAIEIVGLCETFKAKVVIDKV